MPSDIERARARAIVDLAGKLARHGYNGYDGCPECDRYVAAVLGGAKPADVMEMRCDVASSWHAELMRLIEADGLLLPSPDEVVMGRGVTRADVEARMPRMLELFGATSTTTAPVIACRNVDTSKLPIAAEKVEPSILHTVVGCDVCGEKVWIGPAQRCTVGTVTCYICLGILAHYNAAPLDVKILNPNADDVPRRRP